MTHHDHTFRFYDNREKYLLFVTTTNEKDTIARRIGSELQFLDPDPPALTVFDAGMGDATVLNGVLEELHWQFPTIPLVVIGKEISMEDSRLGLARLQARFAEHPELIVVVTNMYYREAPALQPADGAEVKWWDIPLEGTTAHEFGRQLRDLGEIIAEGWQTEPSGPSGRLRYKHPSVVVLYRRDHRFALQHVIPTPGWRPDGYDLVIAAQPYRSRTGVEFKVNKILAPLARALAPKGRMIVVQSTGNDPGMELIRAVWPGEDPFATPRGVLTEALDAELNRASTAFSFGATDDESSLFTYSLHALPEVVDNVGTSQALAAWNAAVYVAQIDADRVNDVLQSGEYLAATRRVLHDHGGLWFQNEAFVVVRDAG